MFEIIKDRDGWISCIEVDFDGWMLVIWYVLVVEFVVNWVVEFLFYYCLVIVIMYLDCEKIILFFSRVMIEWLEGLCWCDFWLVNGFFG